MDKNTFFGLLLIGAILIGFSWWNGPSEQEVEENRRKRDSIENVQRQQLQLEQERLDEIKTKEEQHTTNDSLAKVSGTDSLSQSYKKELFGLFAPATEGEEKEFIIENDKMIVTISSLGGRVKSVELKDYQTYDSSALLLFDETSEFNLNFFTRDNKNIFTDELYFNTNVQNIILSGEEQKAISYKLEISSEKYIEFVYGFEGNSYLIDFDVNFVGMDEVISNRASEVYLNWTINTPNQEKSIKNQRDVTTIFYRYGEDDVDYISPTTDERMDYEASIKWVSFKQQFFNTTLIADDYFDKSSAFAETTTNEESLEYVKTLKTGLTVPLKGNRIENFGMAFYFGPNKYRILNRMDNEMEEIIDLGWGIFGWINKIAVIPVFNFLGGFGMNYGLIILILTILLKLVLSPITYKTYMSSAKMRVLKPEITELNEKYKDDAMKKQQAMMSLYKQTGVNPLSGCIPMLIQMPILFAMFRFFPASIELRQESFLWADDLSTYDSILDLGFHIPFYGSHVSLFTLLMAVSIMFYTKMNSQMGMGGASEGPMAAQMKVMMYIMPFMMLFFFNSYSAGLSYYYFLSNVISILQTVVIRKAFINEDAIRSKIEMNKKKPKSTKKSGFQKRLEEMAKQQQMQKGKSTKGRKR